MSRCVQLDEALGIMIRARLKSHCPTFRLIVGDQLLMRAVAAEESQQEEWPQRVVAQVSAHRLFMEAVSKFRLDGVVNFF